MSALRDFYEEINEDMDYLDDQQLQELMEQAEWEAEEDEPIDEETV